VIVGGAKYYSMEAKTQLKKLLFTLVMIGALSLGSTVFATGDISIEVKNKQIPTDSPPTYDQGRVLVPLRAVSKALGATVDWNQKTKTVTVRKWSEKVMLTIGKKAASVEKKGGTWDSSGQVPLDVSVKTFNNRVYVPLRFISEQYGYKVDWNNNTVSIQSPLDQNQKEELYLGDLLTSRKFVMDAMFSGIGHYEYPPLQTLHGYEDYSTIFLFPDGETLRFFVIEGNETVTYFEYQDDFLVATWQAHINNTRGDSIQQLLEDNLIDRTGPTPKINNSFIYYSSGFMGESSWEESGQISIAGIITKTGFKRVVAGMVTDSSGTITLTRPDEIRKEVIKIPH